MRISNAEADKRAFGVLARSIGVECEDLSANDNRSQTAVARNLDYRLRTINTEYLIEFEGREARGGRIQPSQLWLKEDELDALIEWQSVSPEARRALIVFGFRTDGEFVDRPIEVQIDCGTYSLNYAFVTIEASAYKARCRRRSANWKTVKLDRLASEQLASSLSEMVRLTSRAE